jgi:hypothetical protein
MVGNGVTNWKYDGDPAFVEMGLFYGLYGMELANLLHDNKCNFYYIDVLDPNDTDECMALYKVFVNLTS